MCGLRLLNEEAAEPFLLLSNYTPCLCLRESERASEPEGRKVLLQDLTGALFAFSYRLLERLMLAACVRLNWGGPGEDTQWGGEPVATGPLYC